MELYSETAIQIIDELHTERLDCESEYIPLIEAAQRLEEYEKTGFEPHEIEEQKFFIAAQKDPDKLKRLRELVEADEDGRCLVLPCKCGDRIWKIYDDCTFPADCKTRQMCNGCEYRNVFVEEQAFCLTMLSQNGKLEFPYYKSKEEAVSALEGMRK